jgi:hypothetical protein
MIEGVTCPFDLEPPQLTAEQIAEAARLYNQGIVQVYEQFSPDNPNVDSVTVEAPLGEDEEVSFNVSRAGIVFGFAPDQLHSWGRDAMGAVVRDDSSLYEIWGSNTPDRERELPHNVTLEARLRHIKDRAAQDKALGMSQ